MYCYPVLLPHMHSVRSIYRVCANETTNPLLLPLLHETFHHETMTHSDLHEPNLFSVLSDIIMSAYLAGLDKIVEKDDL